MSSFTQPLILVPKIEYQCWATTQPLTYEIGVKGSELQINVPSGFLTDLATIPRLLWPLFPPHHPRLAAAAVLHDYLYTQKGFTRVVADAIFYEAMRVLNVPRPRAILMYLAVRLFNHWR